MATAAGTDPYEYRLSLLDKQPRFANVLKLAAEKAGWGNALPTGRARGIALMEGYDTYMAQVAEISVKDNEIKVHRVTAVADLGLMVNPDTVEAQIQSSIAFGLSAALFEQITLENGRVQQTNFNNFPVVRMHEMPQIEVVLINSTEKPGGIGEPATALIGPAVANALFAATGKRVRKLPLSPENIARA
jgi:isoquinoline 1-oxidoreductase beta subunit